MVTLPIQYRLSSRGSRPRTETMYLQEHVHMTQPNFSRQIPKKPKRKRGWPAKNKIEPIKTAPEEIA